MAAFAQAFELVTFRHDTIQVFFHVAAVFLFVNATALGGQGRTRVAPEDEVAGLVSQDFLLVVHYFVKRLVTQLLDEWVVLQEAYFDLCLLVFCAGPDFFVENFLADFEENAFVGDHDRKYGADEAVAAVEGLVADDAAGGVLGHVLEFQRVLVVVPEDDSPVEDDEDMVFFALDNVADVFYYYV